MTSGPLASPAAGSEAPGSRSRREPSWGRIPACKASLRRGTHTSTLLSCGDEGKHPSQGLQKMLCLLAYCTGAQAPAADNPLLNLAFLPTALCKFNGRHFPLQLAKPLHFILVLDARAYLPKLLTCSCFKLSRSTVLTLTFTLPPSSPSHYFTIQNRARAKQICL